MIAWSIEASPRGDGASAVGEKVSELAIAVVDYGAGNLRSVVRALQRVGADVVLTEAPEVVRRSDVLVLPGQGAARDAMANLHRLGLVKPILEHVRAGRPFIGVCLGLQVLLDRSEEHGGVECLGIIPGAVRRFPPGLKVPQIGWNSVRWQQPHPIWDGVPQASYFYFVHSYFADVADPAAVGGTTDYGIPFASVLLKDNIAATQFHPEKSGDVGLRLYANLLRWAQLRSEAKAGPLTRADSLSAVR